LPIDYNVETAVLSAQYPEMPLKANQLNNHRQFVRLNWLRFWTRGNYLSTKSLEDGKTYGESQRSPGG